MSKDEFKRVWLPLSGNFYRVAYVMLKSEADAKDAVQDLYVKLWNMRGVLDSVQNPLSYGVKVLRNLCIDRIRMSQITGRGESIEYKSNSGKHSVTNESADKSFYADSRIITMETVTAVRKALDSLPEIQSKVMELKFFKNLDYDEIASLTGLSQGNVRVMVSRARKSILQFIKKESVYGTE